MDWAAVDSIIFDMDGTLWDATESYSRIWNICSEKAGIKAMITPEELKKYMGMTLDDIFKNVHNVAKDFDIKKYLSMLEQSEEEMMPLLGGKPYPDMRECIKELSAVYKLFMVSNCGKNGLENFMKLTGTTEYFMDSLTFGGTNKNKSENIKTLIEKYDLKSPVYMGDTQGDCDQTHSAGIPFVFARYGFGTCKGYDLTFDSIKDFTEYFLKLKD